MNSWFRLVAWLKVLWVCRVSFLVALSAFLFVKIQPASDLLLDLRPTGSWELWGLFFLAFVVWTIVIYVSARLAVMSHAWAISIPSGAPIEIDEYHALRQLYLWPTRILPIIIPAIGAAFVVAALLYARQNIPDLPDSTTLESDLQAQLLANARAAAAYTVIVLIAVFALYRVGSHRESRWPAFLPNLKVVDEQKRPLTRRQLENVGERDRVSVWFILLAVITFGVVLVALAAFLARPQLATEFQRATLAFVLLSLWIPVLTVLAILSHKLRFPLMLTVVVASLVIFNLVGDNHQIRTEVADAPTPAQRLSIDDWVERWRLANDCPETGSCPTRPILISASGGASRAAFFTASTIGRLLDLTCVAADGGCRDGQPSIVPQIFAISSVSGSTLGAAAWVTALDHYEDLEEGGPLAQPCKGQYTVAPVRETGTVAVVKRWFGRVWHILWTPDDDVPDWDRHAFDFWHGVETTNADGNFVDDWQDCLELIVTGDYLSPAVASLVVRDVLPIRIWDDRNRALEDAFDRHISAVLADPDGTDELIFDREFLTLWQRQMGQPASDGAARPLWRPLLISNGSSVSYGNRILTTPIAKDRDWPFLDATDAYALLNKSPDGNCGLPIKTAVTNSARFPLVSTEGDFPRLPATPSATCEDDAPIFGTEVNEDQIVDGGYYESIGLTSVYDLALALKARGLDPFVVSITNDPSVFLACPRDREPQSEGVGGAFGTPIEAVSAARSARGVMSLEALKVLSGLTVGVDADKQGVEGNMAMLRAKAAAGAQEKVAMRAGPGGPGSETEETPAERKAACLVETYEVPADVEGAPPRTVERDYGEDFAFVDVIHPQNIFGDEMPSISLNWWLSRPVQMLLRANVEAEHNKAAFRRICEVLDDSEASRQCLNELRDAKELEIVPPPPAAN